MQENRNSSDEFIFSLVNIQYGYIAHCIATSNHKEALKYLVLAENNLRQIEMTNYNPSVVKSYKSAFFSFRAVLDGKTALNSVMSALDFAEKAIKEDSTNYFGFLQRGNIYRHSPVAFNGSKQKAIVCYLKAESLLLKDIISKKNWNYMHLLVTITETYIEVNDFKEAAIYFDKILKLEPGFYKLNDELGPKIKTAK